jgi:hypothetical protein
MATEEKPSFAEATEGEKKSHSSNKTEMGFE